jgi:hypothetical protein
MSAPGSPRSRWARCPRAVQLPSGRVVELRLSEQLAPRSPAAGAPLFSEVVDLFESGDVALHSDGAPLAVYLLELCDFHALRAILTAAGLLTEETLDLTCRNCDAPLAHAPCAAMPLGPFVDRELTDPELDARLDLMACHEIPPVRVGRSRMAREIRLAPVTVEGALPLFRALAAPELALTGDVVRAMGIAELVGETGGETNPARIARALSAASDRAWSAVTELFLAAHYAPRLFSIALCPKCGARNDVDAPYDREFDAPPCEPREPRADPREDGSPAAGSRPRSDPALAARPPSEDASDELPAFDPFAERGRVIAKELFEAEGVTDVVFVADGGVPAVDDGGEPLMGAYLPGTAGEMGSPSRAHEITVYYRTFRAIWDEDGPFDWDAELRETIAHELDHHLAFLAGDDPMDDEERAEIRDEAIRVLGKRALVREGVRTFGEDALEFLRRTWPIWLLAAVATAIATLSSR